MAEVHPGSHRPRGGEWNAWYAWAVPADDLYDTYLAELRDEGLT